MKCLICGYSKWEWCNGNWVCKNCGHQEIDEESEL